MRVAVFDMDSTLIDQEVIDELAREAGVGERVAAITERAMAGELDFTQSLTARVALLKGLSKEALESVYRRLTLKPGAKELVTELKRRGYYTAVVSGGFEYFASRIATRIGLDEFQANVLQIHEERLTGRLENEIVIDAAFKKNFLVKLCERQGVPLACALAVGDGANDIPMIQAAGIGVAFNAKPKVQAAAKFAVNKPSLMSILECLTDT